MTYSRESLGDALDAQLNPDESEVLPFRIITDPREVPPADGTIRGTVQIVREEFTRNKENPQGDYLETFSVWVLSSQITRGQGEDDLDDLAQEVVDALDAIDWASWTTAKRQQHPQSGNAYQITVQTITEK